MKTCLILVGFTILLLLTLAPAGPSAAQSGGGYDLTWNTIDGGGGNATGGNYTLDGTIGQAEAGMLGGGGYTLNGGFWTSSATQYRCYLPIVISNH